MPSPYDLVDLADLKTWLDLTSTDDDDFLPTFCRRALWKCAMAATIVRWCCGNGR